VGFRLRLPDPVSQPALSRDGRMLTFVRSPNTFYAVGRIYVKTLPDGEPVQLTHDSLKKTNPAFSPDGTRIAYTAVDPQFNWDTWAVPTRGRAAALATERLQPDMDRSRAGALL
jgi:Tol biopolymer transport system component